MVKRVLVLIVFVLIFNTLFLSCLKKDDVDKKKFEKKLELGWVIINSSRFEVEIASTQEEQSRGLMFRKNMDYNKGMFFVNKSDKMRSFWMKNTYLPLSIAFINSKGLIVSISDMKPLDINSTSSIYPAKYVLEVNKGAFAKMGIVKGMKVEWAYY